ncbi:MAG: general secretion pathway protein GspK [Gammaproteobacteria bacterium]|nr:general secretion pathway protein GspK [Gammaproteobacteria bacterium]
MRRQSGIALIQVLLVTGIIGLLMLQMGLTAREQVARAQALADRAELQLAAQSREAALLYSLLTEPMVQVEESKNPYAAAWNFRGQPFTVDEVTFTIQDESGKMRIPDQQGGDFERLLAALGVEPTRARKLTLELMAMQGVNQDLRTLGNAGDATMKPAPGLFPLQYVGQLRLLPDLDADLYRRLRPLLTLYPTPGFNPTTAPPDLLSAQMTKSQVTGVEDARKSDTMDAQALWKLTGEQANETTVLLPGPGLTVRLDMGLREVHLTRTTTYSVRPYQDEALAVWQRSGADGKEE